jgi:hypothetical protein
MLNATAAAELQRLSDEKDKDNVNPPPKYKW